MQLRNNIIHLKVDCDLAITSSCLAMVSSQEGLSVIGPLSAPLVRRRVSEEFRGDGGAGGGLFWDTLLASHRNVARTCLTRKSYISLRLVRRVMFTVPN